MTYFVIDTYSVPNTLNRDDVDQLLVELNRDNPEANWLAVQNIRPFTADSLEMLYALADLLLKESGINPLALQLEAEDDIVSAARIMRDAREQIDTLIAYRERYDAARYLTTTDAVSMSEDERRVMLSIRNASPASFDEAVDKLIDQRRRQTKH